MCGDFNCPWAEGTQVHPTVDNFTRSFNLKQHVVVSTRIAGNILDLLINQEDDSFISDIVVSSVSFTDHYLVKSKLCTVKESQPIVTIRKRNLKKLNLNDFKTRLYQSSSFTEPAGVVDDFVDQIEATL